MAKKRRKPLRNFPSKKKRFNKKQRDFDDPKYIAWKEAVSKRDKGKCQWPGCRNNRYVEIHHIRRWADCPALRFTVSNGIVLCCKHHKHVKNKEDDYAPFLFKILEKKLARKLGGLDDQSTTEDK